MQQKLKSFVAKAKTEIPLNDDQVVEEDHTKETQEKIVDEDNAKETQEEIVEEDNAKETQEKKNYKMEIV